MSGKIISDTIAFVKRALEDAETGHDWFHTERVWKTAKAIASIEGGNILVIELAALLHDIADAKFHNGNENLAVEISENFLKDCAIEENIMRKVLFIIKHLSFRKRKKQPQNLPLEFKIVQDADRLDAIGAIGIARAFNYGGFKNNPMYHPDIPPHSIHNQTFEKHLRETSINHFYEKLLLLKDLMHTHTAKTIAKERHDFMLLFLRQFQKELDIKNKENSI